MIARARRPSKRDPELQRPPQQAIFVAKPSKLVTIYFNFTMDDTASNICQVDGRGVPAHLR